MASINSLPVMTQTVVLDMIIYLHTHNCTQAASDWRLTGERVLDIRLTFINTFTASGMYLIATILCQNAMTFFGLMSQILYHFVLCHFIYSS